MNPSIKEQFPDSSRAVADIAVKLVFENPDLFSEIASLCFEGEMPWAARAARVLSICCVERPEFFIPLRKKILNALKKTKNESILRNLLKIYSEIPVKLTDDEKSVLLSHCFDMLISDNMPVAIKVYSMDILFRLTGDFPEIGFELYSILENSISFGSAGYKSKAGKIMKALAGRGHK